MGAFLRSFHLGPFLVIFWPRAPFLPRLTRSTLHPTVRRLRVWPFFIHWTR